MKGEYVKHISQTTWRWGDCSSSNGVWNNIPFSSQTWPPLLTHTARLLPIIRYNVLFVSAESNTCIKMAPSQKWLLKKQKWLELYLLYKHWLKMGWETFATHTVSIITSCETQFFTFDQNSYKNSTGFIVWQGFGNHFCTFLTCLLSCSIKNRC